MLARKTFLFFSGPLVLVFLLESDIIFCVCMDILMLCYGARKTSGVFSWIKGFYI